MQVAPQAPPLLLARVDQPLARTLEVGGEAHGVGGGLGVAGEVVEQAPICRAERLARGAGGEYQLPDGLRPVGERQDERLSFGPPYSATVSKALVPLEGDRHVG